MLWQALTAVRDIGRLHDITSILIRYGFGDMVRRMGLANALERAGRALHWNEAQELAHLDPPARVRRALEELGPTFVKLGQVLATRIDLFEPEWIAEFGKLQDSAPAASYAGIRQQLTEDLGAPPEEVFAAFDPEPLAAASVAQVHRARLEDGSEVVVKVRRPGIRPIIEADLRWLARLAKLAEGESPELRAFRPQEVVRQFSQSLRRELDFAGECRNAEHIAENFAGYTDKDEPTGDASAEAAPEPPPALPIIIIPRVYWQWTGERVCVQEFIAGISGRKLATVDEAGLDRKVLARRGAHAVLKMIVEDGFFHADPHPGNVFYLPGNRIAFIDFGMVGRLTEVRRDQLTGLLLGLVKHEPRRVADVMLDWTGDGAMDEDGLLVEIQTFVQQYHGVALKQLRLGAMLSDLVAILRQHQLALPPDLSLLIKAFISLEGMGRELDPDFDMAGEAMPLLEQALRARYAPTALLQRGWRGVSEALSLVAGLPQDISRLLRAARRGRLEIHIDITHLKRVGNQLDSAANRLVVGIVVAALIIGSSIVMTVPGGPTLLGLPFFGLLGFVGAVIGSLWLLLSIWRSGGKE
ncbi:ubiquinone biosynthesis protein UbiB [Janthinobacterium lividum]|uniref:Ubiquinone biosynthesis protein UbiB n=3 Tax=Betaproteobacteria TaxID=28216 RepID=A0A6C2CE94_9RHOO|nr:MULTISPECIES: AarF/UbiB family protein [Betaproteobacteria]EIF32065.1 putative unusual protein kinase [Burkholderia sp. Ch1-1]MDO9611364.1 AarF/UbiB family protein [Serpentinimonas sp.]ABM39461.1 2-octaprenylphenol hydroxylase [Polaromonas naphthalenivorans CJ2]OHV99011.1 ubiquinone biosynthesis protein UbiB [Janthinobacterium lividum]TYC51585.1 ubiquinone biosynthesis protein UbiB [Zoogloea oleivorans]